MTKVLDDRPKSGKRHHGYRLRIEPARGTVRAIFDGRVVAESDAVLVMHETRYPPVYYFPRAAVDWDLLEPASQHTHCPFKGNASYWSLNGPTKSAANAAWSYESPFDEATPVKDYVAFYWNAIDEWSVDGKTLGSQPRSDTTAGTRPRARSTLRWVRLLNMSRPARACSATVSVA